MITSYFVYSFDHKATSGQFKINDIIINATVVITPILINIIYIYIFFLSFFLSPGITNHRCKKKIKKETKKKKKHFVIYAIRRPRMKQIGAPPPPPPPPPNVHACSISISNYKFRIHYQSSISKQQNNNLLLYTRVYYNVRVYEHACLLFHG